MIPLQPAEKKVRDLYQNLVKVYGDSPIATDARFELAELLAQRKEFMPALLLLGDVLDKEPPLDLTEKVRLRLGEIYTFQGNFKGALANFETVAKNAKSAWYGQAVYGAAEINLANNQIPEAIKRLTLFVNQPNLQKQPGLTDRALLRLGHAYERAKNWDESRKARHSRHQGISEQPVGRRSTLRSWVRSSAAQANAASCRQLCTGRWPNLHSGRGQGPIADGPVPARTEEIHGGDRGFDGGPDNLRVPGTKRHALFEAARAHTEAKEPQDAMRLYERIVRDYPGTTWAKAAAEKLKKQ